MLTVLTWYWKQPGGRSEYTAEHVNIWADMVRRNLSLPHEIACVTDLPDGIDSSIKIITPPRDFEDWRIPSWGPDRPQCLRRIAMFGPRAGDLFGERFVCMDLDCVVTGELDSLFSGEEDFRIYQGTAPGRFYNGSMMMIRAGSRPQVYDNFSIKGATEAGKKFIGSDQAWIAYCLGPNERTWGPNDGVQWYKNSASVRGAKIVFFPGSRKPWQLLGIDARVTKHYHRTFRAGKVLILGYAPTVWDEALAALERSTYDAVIASPEAAAHWPGDVFAVANDDAHAERLAVMHGFTEVTWCGRSPEETVE